MLMEMTGFPQLHVDGDDGVPTPAGGVGLPPGCGNEDTYYCNVTIAVHLVAKKNPSAASFNSTSRRVRYYASTPNRQDIKR